MKNDLMNYFFLCYIKNWTKFSIECVFLLQNVQPLNHKIKNSVDNCFAKKQDYLSVVIFDVAISFFFLVVPFIW